MPKLVPLIIIGSQFSESSSKDLKSVIIPLTPLEFVKSNNRPSTVNFLIVL